MLRALTRLLAAAVVLSATAQTVPAAEFGDVSVLAQVPVPNGFPEGLAVRGDRFYVAGPATFGTSINGKASRFFEFDLPTGALLRTIETQGEQVFGAEHANSCLAFDGQGQLYVLNNQLGTLRFSAGALAQSSYTPPFPNDPACLPLGLSGGKSCSPTVTNMPALPNDLAFDDAGNLYVTDSMQATIWRIPPGGGAPQAWFRDSRFASPYIGVNGLRLSPDRGQLFITVTTDMLGFGRVYTLPLKEAPTKDDLKLWHNFAPGDGPDGIAFGASGKLYVTLALPGKSGIAILEPDGTESARIMNPPLSLISPFDSPANVAFDGQGNLLVTNHAFATGLVIPHQFQVLKVFVDDVAMPMAEPLVP
ncbi:MAG TPA: SMP-30/gluconolactonase/LRE family protein [Nevskiaceae bacterium]|nr:SMP-30/gluconolactonase/LRE family protein [Nevskiaceae bacterium]